MANHSGTLFHALIMQYISLGFYVYCITLIDYVVILIIYPSWFIDHASNIIVILCTLHLHGWFRVDHVDDHGFSS